MKEDDATLKLVYTFFVGLLLAIFVGVGVSTFYAPPTAPEYPISAEPYRMEPTAEQIKVEREFEETRIKYDADELQPYNRNVSIIVILSAVILLVISIVFENKIKVIADGIMLGGLFALMYGLGRGFASQDTRYVFAIVTVSLCVVLYMGYHRFVMDDKETDTKK